MELSRGITIVKEYDTSIFFHLSCACISPECTKTLEMHYDEPTNSIDFIIYVDLTFSKLYSDNWFIHQYNKIKGIFKIIFNIPLTYQSEICIQDETQLTHFIEALQYGYDKLSKFKHASTS